MSRPERPGRDRKKEAAAIADLARQRVRGSAYFVNNFYLPFNSNPLFLERKPDLRRVVR
jgi:hypothetical protein